ncbi:TPA: streptomycin phosphotransferase [Candidatus Dependentiae bacterium]|nr:MAG: hypothetical protein UR14_C0001G0090 [candidate division TM6 bacterium GW2011_GWE2_31_21]KKP54030.1 MAG: hypothetical protein UR43_C0001G0048 [candidate division TM6 bacterium GW2011_GWF2_33_332]HBS48388.1 streptomycin phosphotransferase [Candidatus Dependentiae bacterium]HBZ72938.1 streptomycin phosphotransferase [Candidatus Dependentiae bacterium]
MHFKKNIISLYGKQGEDWLYNLPNLVKQFAKIWGLSNLKVLPNLTYNYALSCTQGNIPTVLKLGFYNPELQYEIQALKLFAGHGCVAIIEHDFEQGAILLQRAVPGTSLKTLFPKQDREATLIASQIIKDLQNIKPHKLDDLPGVEDWLATLDKNWNIPKQYLEKARELKKFLLATTTHKALLHGDLHNDNILSCGDNQWISIDPKGGIGDPVYEVGAPVRNPVPKTIKNDAVQKIIEGRIDLLAEFLEFDRQRIFDWAFVQVVLGACWSLENRLDPAFFLKMAEAFAAIEKYKS